jgi:beta-ribofuranosylaminobenzene 5'-phosphate synthase
MSSTVHVRAPCRLHFGMVGFGQADWPQFGGVGVMVEPPAIEVTIGPAAEFRATGTLSDRARQVVKTAVTAWNLPNLPPCEIAVDSPRDHVGLGVGTQLSLAIATALRLFLRLPERSWELLAQDVSRGKRSSVGTFGFHHGGLIVDAGHTPGESIGKLALRVGIPGEWRFVLASRADRRGLAGRTESDAFLQLPAVPEESMQKLCEIAYRDMVPALERRECQAFGDSVYRFGRLAGECFAAVQGGPFATGEIAKLVDSIRAYGIPGAGQSSWGPTVFAICESEAEANSLRDWLGSRAKSDAPYDVSIASPNNEGARIETA